jgi:predicted dehydrogenase
MPLSSPRGTTRARFAAQALLSGKDVFVEKPLAITIEEVALVESALAQARGGRDPVLTVGFNRRFSPLWSDCASCLHP